MTIDPTNPQLQLSFSARDAPEIAQCLQTLFTTPIGTVALERDFGIDFSIIDLPIEEAKARYGYELQQKVRRYEPRVKVDRITYEYDAINGTLIPKVVISFA